MGFHGFSMVVPEMEVPPVILLFHRTSYYRPSKTWNSPIYRKPQMVQDTWGVRQEIRLCQGTCGFKLQTLGIHQHKITWFFCTWFHHRTSGNPPTLVVNGQSQKWCSGLHPWQHRRWKVGPIKDMSRDRLHDAFYMRVSIMFLSWKIGWKWIWLVVWNIFHFPIYWENSSQLTKSYFSEGWLKTTNQGWSIWGYPSHVIQNFQKSNGWLQAYVGWSDDPGACGGLGFGHGGAWFLTSSRSHGWSWGDQSLTNPTRKI